jgi:diguanylate cyclase (GGDEF)-like protein
MLIKRLVQTREADNELPPEIRAALVESLFAPIPSLAVGAIACSIVGVAAALRAGDPWIMATSIAIFAVGMLRVTSALLYKGYKQDEKVAATQVWERVYEYGAWAFSGLLGLLCLLTIQQTIDPYLHMIVTTTSIGYAAAISARNAGRPIIAVGQMTFTTLPMTVALLSYPDLVHLTLGFVVLMFMYAMTEITMSIHDILIQGLTMKRKEAALAKRFEQQARRFDIALNNMSHGLCMLDQQDTLQVWNERFLELLHLKNAQVGVGTRVSALLRYAIRAQNHRGRRVKEIFAGFVQSLKREGANRLECSLDGDRTISLSQRTMSDGGLVVILEDVTERKRAQERIARLASFDELTGLANRTQFRARMNATLASVRERSTQIAIQLVDLDRFKSINDTLGHPIGDKLLKETAHRLSVVVSPSDVIARVGGDEFVVLQNIEHGREEAMRLAQLLATTLTDPFRIHGHRIDIGASIGIAVAPADGIDADQLLKKADMALYAAKNDGGGTYRFFAIQMEEAAQERRALELDLRQALSTDQFSLHFQPLVDLRTGHVTTCEALLRWMHPVRGNVSPSEFIPVAEETGLIVELGKWVLQQACNEAVTWPKDIKIAVNLSPVQFRDRTLGLNVISAVAKSGLQARRLELEITERVLLEESKSTLAVMEQLNNLGVGISLDDFGTGYSSFNYLHKFPINKIKIDKSFISDLAEEGDSRSIVAAVASLGADLDKTVVAEGIETEDQMRLVYALGCHEGQGYFFGKPMPGESICARLESTNAKAPQVVSPFSADQIQRHWVGRAS